MPDPARLSVVIPILDSPWVDRTLSGLRAEGAPGEGVEVLLVGRDGAELVPRDGSVRYLEVPLPCPPARARNLGVAAAKGDKLLFVDADCEPRPGWISGLSAALDRAPVAGGAVTFPLDSDRWSLADNIASFHELLADRPSEERTRRPLGSLNLAVTRSGWERTGPFDEELVTSEDLDWVLRARQRGLETSFVAEAVVEHAAVRRSREALERHARWYGAHFHAFCRRHPGLLDGGPTWRSRRRLALTAPLKAVLATLGIYRRHSSLWRCWRALPAVVRFKLAWYGAILDGWEERGRPEVGA